MNKLPEVVEMYFIPKYGEVDGIQAADLDIRVTRYSNGFRSVTEIPEPPSDAPRTEPLWFSELVALAQEGKAVSARDALALVQRHRGMMRNMQYISQHYPSDQFSMGLAQWLYRVQRYMDEEVIV